jgi:hypothetical protein
MSEIKFLRFGLDAVFSQVRSGDYHASSHLKIGNIPLVSCKTENHGIEGEFDIPASKTYENCVTIACDGTPLTSFYHSYRFAAKDNVLVGIPLENLKLPTILYAVAYLNGERWRFSYGRKAYANKIKKLTILYPVTESGKIDENKIAEILKNMTVTHFLPFKTKSHDLPEIKLNYTHIPVSDIFELHSGDYHNASGLPNGSIPLVSCGDTDNGVMRLCSVPEEKTYQNTLTIAYNGSWPSLTKYHPYRFAAKDDVAVCLPRKELLVSTLIFIQYVINRQIWRYSYGRKCFRHKLAKMQLYVPVNDDGEIDEENIAKILRNTNYWDYLNDWAIKNSSQQLFLPSSSDS